MIIKKLITIILVLFILVITGCGSKSQAVSGITKEATDTIHKVSTKYESIRYSKHPVITFRTLRQRRINK